METIAQNLALALQLKNWVAGGYWQAPSSLSPGLRGGRDDNLSRASSQTSGFVSVAGAAAGAVPPQFLMHSRTCSRASSASSGDTSIDRLTQEAFAELRPKAESSPIEKPIAAKAPNLNLEPWLERRVSLNCSLYSLLLAASVAGNLALAVYFVAS